MKEQLGKVSGENLKNYPREGNYNGVAGLGTAGMGLAWLGLA